MALISYLLTAIYWLLNLLSFLIVLRALLSWFPISQENIINKLLITMTEPVMSPIRALLYKLKFTRELPVDFSPVVAILVLWILSSFIAFL